MDRNKMERLNVLFEKMVANNASNAERFELRALYQAYIDESRSHDEISSLIAMRDGVVNW